MKYQSFKKADKCPESGSAKIARILYGLPSFSENPRKKLENNEIFLGGCSINDDGPSW